MSEKKVYPFRSKKTEEEAMREAAVDMMKNLPTNALLGTMETILNILQERGQEIRDFDNKKKVVQQIRLIGLKPYFLAAEPEDEVEGKVAEYESELKQQKENNIFLVKRCRDLMNENERLKKSGR